MVKLVAYGLRYPSTGKAMLQRGHALDFLPGIVLLPGSLVLAAEIETREAGYRCRKEVASVLRCINDEDCRTHEVNHCTPHIVVSSASKSQ